MEKLNRERTQIDSDEVRMNKAWLDSVCFLALLSKKHSGQGHVN